MVFYKELMEIAKRIFEGEVLSHAITTTLVAPSASSILTIFKTELEQANSDYNEINRKLIVILLIHPRI